MCSIHGMASSIGLKALDLTLRSLNWLLHRGRDSEICLYFPSTCLYLASRCHLLEMSSVIPIFKALLAPIRWLSMCAFFFRSDILPIIMFVFCASIGFFIFCYRSSVKLEIWYWCITIPPSPPTAFAIWGLLCFFVNSRIVFYNSVRNTIGIFQEDCNKTWMSLDSTVFSITLTPPSQSLRGLPIKFPLQCLKVLIVAIFLPSWLGLSLGMFLKLLWVGTPSPISILLKIFIGPKWNL